MDHLQAIFGPSLRSGVSITDSRYTNTRWYIDMRALIYESAEIPDDAKPLDAAARLREFSPYSDPAGIGFSSYPDYLFTNFLRSSYGDDVNNYCDSVMMSHIHRKALETVIRKLLECYRRFEPMPGPSAHSTWLTNVLALTHNFESTHTKPYIISAAFILGCMLQYMLRLQIHFPSTYNYPARPPSPRPGHAVPLSKHNFPADTIVRKVVGNIINMTGAGGQTMNASGYAVGHPPFQNSSTVRGLLWSSLSCHPSLLIHHWMTNRLTGTLECIGRAGGIILPSKLVPYSHRFIQKMKTLRLLPCWYLMSRR